MRCNIPDTGIHFVHTSAVRIRIGNDGNYLWCRTDESSGALGLHDELVRIRIQRTASDLEAVTRSLSSDEATHNMRIIKIHSHNAIASTTFNYPSTVNY